MKGGWLYLSMVGAFGLYYGLGYPLPVALAPPPKEKGHAVHEEELTPLEKGIRFVVNAFRADKQAQPRIARQKPPAAEPEPAVAPEPMPPPQPVRAFVEPPRAKAQGFTALPAR